MFNSSNGGYSLADIAAATGDTRDGSSSWDNGAWWIIILFLFAFCGWGNNGWGNSNGTQGALTRADLCQDMNFSDLESAARGIQNGLCDGFYAQNTNTLTGFSNVQNALATGFAGVNNAICSLGYQTQEGVNSINTAAMQNTNTLQQDINAMNVANLQTANALQTQISQCCCDAQSTMKDIEYQMATDTCAIQNSVTTAARDIVDNQNANTKSILDFIVNDKLATLQAENQSLRFAASQAAQNQYLISELRPSPIPAYITCNPLTSSYGLGLGCSYATA